MVILFSCLWDLIEVTKLDKITLLVCLANFLMHLPQTFKWPLGKLTTQRCKSHHFLLQSRLWWNNLFFSFFFFSFSGWCTVFTLIAQCQITASEDPVSPSLCMPFPPQVFLLYNCQVTEMSKQKVTEPFSLIMTSFNDLRERGITGMACGKI